MTTATRYVVVRDDGNDAIGQGHSFHHYEVDEQGQIWSVSPHSDWRSKAEGLYPCERADLRALKSFRERGTYNDDRFWLLYVKEVTR